MGVEKMESYNSMFIEFLFDVMKKLQRWTVLAVTFNDNIVNAVNVTELFT